MKTAKQFVLGIATLSLLSTAALIPTTAEIPPVIDGSLDDACWAKANFVPDFYRYKQSKKSSLKTEVALVYTETHVIFGWRCLETPTPDTIEKGEKAIFKECMEFMLDPAGSKDTYYHFAIGRNGSLYDRKCEQGGYIGDATWESNFDAAVKLENESWSGEAAIPYSALELRNSGAKEWGINIARESSELASILPNGTMHVAGAFLKIPAPSCDLAQYSFELAPIQYNQLFNEGKYNFTITGEIVNHSGTTPNLTVTTLLIGPNENVAFTKNILPNIAKGTSTKYSTSTISVSSDGNYTCYTQLRNTASGRVLCERTDSITAEFKPLSLKVLSPSYRNAIFATQKLEKIRIQANVNLPEQKKQGILLTAGLRLENGTILDSKTSPTTTEQILLFDAKKLPEGNITVFASLKDQSGKVIAEDTDIIKKLPYHKNEVFRDDDGFWYVDGKKQFLLLGWNSTHDLYPEYLATMPQGKNNLAMSAMGFGLYSSGLVARYKKEGWSPYVENFFRQRTLNYMKNESLFAHYWLDEPDCSGWSRDFATRVAKLIADIDPWHPVIISSGTQGITAYPDSGELNGFHCYPSPQLNKPMANFAKIVACLNKYNREKMNYDAPQDLVYLHQGFNYGDNGSINTRVPSYEEYRNQDFLALAMGCTGLLHYNRISGGYPELLIGMPHLIKEQKIVGEHAVIQTPVTLASPDADLKLRAFKNEEDGSYWIIAVYAADGEKTFSLPAPTDGKWQVFGEKRSIATQNNAITDSFTSFQAHIYTTDTNDYQLKPVADIKQLIDDAYATQKKPGNLAFQRYENQVLTVTASSNKHYSRPSYGQSTCLWHVTDGIDKVLFPDMSDYNFCDNTPKQVPDWLELNFHTPVLAGRVVVYPQKNSLKNYELQCSKDGKEWTTLGKVENATSNSQTITFPQQEIKLLRVFITENNGPYSQILEIEVYAE